MQIENFKCSIVCLVLVIVAAVFFAAAAPRQGRLGISSPAISGSARGQSNYYTPSFSGSGNPSPSPIASQYPSASSQRSTGGSSSYFQSTAGAVNGALSNPTNTYSVTPYSSTFSNTAGRYGSSANGGSTGGGAINFSSPSYRTSSSAGISSASSVSNAYTSNNYESIQSAGSRVAVNYNTLPPFSPVANNGIYGSAIAQGVAPGRGIPLPTSSEPVPIAPAVPAETAGAVGVPSDRQAASTTSDESNLNASEAVNDWMAGLLNSANPVSEAETDDFDPLKDANVNCDDASSFPSQDFAAQSDSSKVYLTTAKLPTNSVFRGMEFTKYIRVFGLILLGTEEVGDNTMIHAAKVAAELLDNDDDGHPDNAEVIESLLKYVVVIGYVSNSDESNVFWRDRYVNSRNAGFREQYVCNIHFFEQWAEDASLRFHTIGPADSSSNESNSLRKCHGASSIPFDWTLWYFPFTLAYYGYFDQLPGETKELIKKAMDKAISTLKYIAQYPDDPEMELAGFLVWSYLANLGALECHCNAIGIKGVWEICTSQNLYEFDPEWVKLLDNFSFLPSKLPRGQYNSSIEIPQSPTESSSTIGASEAMTNSTSDSTTPLPTFNNSTLETTTVNMDSTNATNPTTAPPPISITHENTDNSETHEEIKEDDGIPSSAFSGVEAIQRTLPDVINGTETTNLRSMQVPTSPLITLSNGVTGVLP